MLENDLQGRVDGERFRHHDYPVNQMDGVQANTIAFLLSQHAIDDERGANDYLSRVGELGRKFDQLVLQIEARERIGVMPPRFVFDRVIPVLREQERQAGRDSLLCKHLDERAGQIAGLAMTDRERLAGAVRRHGGRERAACLPQAHRDARVAARTRDDG